jgi:hypothetical protein
MKGLLSLFLFSIAAVFCHAQAACPPYSADLIMRYAHSTTTTDMVMVSAHRGLWEYVPENSPAAITAATQACIEMSEVDARLSSDGQPVMLHDAYVDRTTSGHGLVYDLTEAQWAGLQLRDRLAAQTTMPAPLLTDFLSQLATALQNPLGQQYVLVIDCKDTLTSSPPGRTLPTSHDVLVKVYAAVAAYELSNGLGTELRDHIIFKVRFPELTYTSVDPNQNLHDLGIMNCDATPTAICTHLNVWAIWYASDATKPQTSGTTSPLFFPNFQNALYAYLTLARGGVNWFWYPEVFVKAPGDGLQPYIQSPQYNDSTGARLTTTAFVPSNDWPEGISQNTATCCNQKDYKTATDPITKWDFGGDPEYVSTFQGYNLLSGDKTPDLLNFLTARGLRNTSYLVLSHP